MVKKEKKSNVIGMSQGLNIKWKIDEAKDLPLAIIEDTADGVGVLEFGDTPNGLELAKHIIELHNQWIGQ